MKLKTDGPCILSFSEHNLMCGAHIGFRKLFCVRYHIVYVLKSTIFSLRFFNINYLKIYNKIIRGENAR